MMGQVYPEELKKKKVVDLYRMDGEVTYAQVVRDLGGISSETIRNWCQQDDRDKGRLDDGEPTTDEKAELAPAAAGDRAAGEGEPDPKAATACFARDQL